MAGRPRARPRLLVLGAGPAQLGLLEAARARGDLEVIAVDRDPQAVGFPLADERAVLSTEDEEGIERLARARDVDGIVSPGADWPVGIAARVAARIGLAHPIDPRTRGGRDVEAPAARGVRGSRRPARARARPGRPPPAFPCVVKAPDRQGQRGLTLVRAARSSRPRSRRRGRVARRRRPRRGARRRARGDGQRVLRSTAASCR